MNSRHVPQPDKIKPSSLDRCLSCLSHPSIVVSVVLLVVNDHLLKHFYPGVITGKISDFAGLYFFPFLIALVLSLLVGKSDRDIRYLGIFSFLVVAALFTAIKTIPSANNCMEAILRSIIGMPSAIALDPSDLVALPSLLLSWKLWNRQVQSPQRRSVWLVIGLASLASAATSCPEAGVITQFQVQDDTIYAAAPNFYSWFVSDDNGLSWQYLPEAPHALADELDRELVLPKITCDPDEVNHCLRVSGNGFVEQTADGGLTWTIAWEVPRGRREIMDRLASGYMCGKQIDLGPYDIAFVSSNGDRIALIAMGNEGVLRLNPEGNWSRVPVGVDATPTPFRAQVPMDIVRLLWPEAGFLVGLGISVWIILNWLYWRPVLLELASIPAQEERPKWILKPLLRSVSIFLVVLMGSILLQMLTGVVLVVLFMTWPCAILVLLIPLVGHLQSWRRLRKAIMKPEVSGGALKIIMLGTTATIVLLLTPLILWTLGYIAQYEVALLMSAGLTIVSLAIAIRKVRSYTSTTVEGIHESGV